MAKGYQIGVGVDTKAAKQGIETGLVDPLEDAQKELLELGKNKGPEQLERSLRDAAKETEDLKDETEKTARAIEKEYKRAYREVKDSADGASQGVDDFNEEAKQSLRETAASISDVSDGLDAVQEIAANAFAGFGPAGAAAGIAAAVGIGLVSAAIGENIEAANEMKEALTDAYREAAEEGRTYLSEAQIIAAATDIYFDEGKLKSARDQAERLGVSVESYIRAISGDQTELNGILDFGAQKLAEMGQIGEDKSKAGQAAALAEKQAYESALVPLEKTAAQHDANRQSAQDYEAFVTDSNTKQREQINRTADTAAARLTGLANQSVNVKLTVDDSAVNRALEQAKKNAKIRLDVTDRYGRNI